jgi:hypothetical protein
MGEYVAPGDRGSRDTRRTLRDDHTGAPDGRSREVAVLATVYVIGVLGVGAVVSSARGQATSELMVAVSTLAAAALFRPVRRRVQMRVDRRFNRTGYEARKVVVAFSQGLRDRVDLDEISAGLVAASVQALEPSHASVWLPRRP